MPLKRPNMWTYPVRKQKHGNKKAVYYQFYAEFVLAAGDIAKAFTTLQGGEVE